MRCIGIIKARTYIHDFVHKVALQQILYYVVDDRIVKIERDWTYDTTLWYPSASYVKLPVKHVWY
jgi:hypothetical protein